MNFRCPDCHRIRKHEKNVTAHREHHQGKCFDLLDDALQRQIIMYRQQFNITPPPLPVDPWGNFRNGSNDSK